MPAQIRVEKKFKQIEIPNLEEKLAEHFKFGLSQNLFHGATFGVVTPQGYVAVPLGKISRHGAALEGNEFYDLASITKAVTACLYHSIHDARKVHGIGLGDRVTNFLKVEGDYVNELMVRHLLLYLAEYPGQVSEMAKNGNNVVSEILRNGLTVSPGKAWQYCEHSPILLGRLLEKATGKRLDTLMQEEIFDPLGMKETTFYPEHLRNSPLSRFVPVERGYRGVVHDEGAGHMLRTFNQPIGSAGLFSTCDDVLRFLALFLNRGLAMDNRRILSRETVNRIGENWISGISGKFGFGSGFGRWAKFSSGYTKVASTNAFFKSGYTGCFLGVFPADKLGIFIGTDFLARNGRVNKKQLFRWVSETVADVILLLRRERRR